MYYLGIDLGGTNIAVGITDEKGNVLAKGKVKTKKERDCEEIIKDMCDLCFSVMNECRISQDEIKSIGMGTPGVCDTKSGIFIYASNFHFKNINFRKSIQKYINLPVYIGNDANCAALAEHIKGAARGAVNSIMITLGTGVGGGIIIDNKIYTAENNCAGELGHTILVKDGYPCNCGRKGCFEVYASAPALVRMTKEEVKKYPGSKIFEICNGNLDEINAMTAYKAKREGDPCGKVIVEMYEDYLAEGIANMLNIFSPEIFVIGGGVSHEGEYMLKPLREKVYRMIYSARVDGVKNPEIAAAVLGNDAGIVGAAALGSGLT